MMGWLLAISSAILIAFIVQRLFSKRDDESLYAIGEREKRAALTRAADRNGHRYSTERVRETLREGKVRR
jgi:hypothetical protein